MRIQYISDLHLECSDFLVEKNGDVLVLAGDIFSGQSVQRFEHFMERTMGLGFDAVLYVLGNHEGYGWSIPEARNLLLKMDTEYANFWYLDRTGILVDGQRFIGASLWSNPTQNANVHARLYINDYNCIKDWSMDDHIREHFKDLNYLTLAIREGDVVITHFPPTYNGVDKARFDGDVLNSWFTNKLGGLIKRLKPKLWISGHTHHTWDVRVGATQDVGNCRGYSSVNHSTGQRTNEVKHFDPTRAITIEVTHYSPNGVAS